MKWNALRPPIFSPKLSFKQKSLSALYGHRPDISLHNNNYNDDDDDVAVICELVRRINRAVLSSR